MATTLLGEETKALGAVGAILMQERKISFQEKRKSRDGTSGQFQTVRTSG
jgi:hypothetical protein